MTKPEIKAPKSFKKILSRLLIFNVILGLVISCFFVSALNQAQQARFNVDALAGYIFSHFIVENSLIGSLAELPDFHIISPADSLSLKSDDLKQGIKDGYIYDLQVLEDGRYVISASPVGLFSSRTEFGITDEGGLKINKTGVDVIADSYEEVMSWEEIPRNDQMRTKKLPDYRID